MICRNLQLRPLAWTTTLLYFMSVEAPQQALGTHREVPHSSQCYSTWAPELVWVKQAKEEVTEQGPPPPHCSLNHTHSSPPCLNTELLGSCCHLPPVNLCWPPQPRVCPLPLGHMEIWVCTSNTRTVLLQQTKSL